LTDKIETAFVSGSRANDKESKGSDIDLMVIGDVNFASLVKALHPEQQALK
jgi:predicted nucleotidyltransferase